MRELSWPPRRESPWEQEADEVATDVALGGRRPDAEALQRGAQLLAGGHSSAGSDHALRTAVGSRYGVDLSGVRVVPNSPSALAAGTLAFAQRGEVHLAPGAHQPGEPLGRALLAHEFAHAAQLSGAAIAAHDQAHRALPPLRGADRGLRLHFCDGGGGGGTSTATAPPAPAPAPPPPAVTGTSVRTEIDTRVAAYNEYAAIQLALGELSKGKASEFHQKTTRPRVEALCKGVLKLSAPDQAARLAEFDAFLDGAKTKKKWDAKAAAAFLAAIAPPVVKQLQGAQLTTAQQNQNLNWLQNTPAQVLQVILDASTAQIPPALLYAAAVNEGLVDVYIRGQLSSPGTQLTGAELSAVKTTVGVSGFQALGLDRYFEELTEKKKPLSGYLPSTFDATKVTEEANVNEKQTAVRSAHVADLKTGLQILAAILSRRMDLFLESATVNGYAVPPHEERLYFAYVFYNSGASEGRRTLTAHKPGGADPRVLADWISKGEYANAQKVLRTYRFIVASGVLRGF